MEFRKIQALRGPNLWANFPVLEAWVDLGVYKDCSSDEVPGLNERLMTWLPTMIEHRCSIGERGGFFERLRRGTYPAHILEHITLELSTLAGCDVGYGKARETNEEGVYRVIVEYEEEDFGRAALHVGRELYLAAFHDRPFDVAGEVVKLRALYEHLRLNPTSAALKEAARKRKIPVQRLTEDGMLQLGYGIRQHRVHGSRTDRTSALSATLASDNLVASQLLRAAGVPVPDGIRLINSVEDVWQAAHELGGPILLKPRYRHRRRGTSGPLSTREEMQAAFQVIGAETSHIVAERHASGPGWRLLVAAGRVQAAVLRAPTGTVPVPLSQIHPEVLERAVDAARTIGLDIAGIEIVADSLEHPLEERGGVVVAVVEQPGLRMFLDDATQQRRSVADAVIESVFPESENGRIPIVGVTGVNGKTTTTRLIAHIVGRHHRCVGFTCTEGVYVGSRRIESGDCSGPASARMILQNPRVDAAVFETARGGILRAGLGYDGCDVGVVTNIDGGDHLGVGGIDTPEQLAKVKRVVVEAVHPTGCAVLKANDPLVAAMAEHCRGSVTFFARDPHDPVIVEHRAKKGRVAFVRNNSIILAEGDQEIPLVPLSEVPLTHGGHIYFQVENALAAAAAAWGLGIPCEVIRIGLETFGSEMESLPGRFNLFEVRGGTVVLDYGHNPSSLERLLEVLQQMPHLRRSAVYSTAGDRRDCDLVRQGELLGDFFDRVILFEDHYLRGRQSGEIIALFRQGVDGRKRVKEVLEIRGAVNAMEVALQALKPGELLLMQADVVDESVDFMQNYLLGANAGREITFDEAIALGQGDPLVSGVVGKTW